MVRKTALVAAMLAALSSQAFAMGLGDIRLNSVLNQPLDADIELLSPTAVDVAALRVILASPTAYSRAGVEREFFHTKLKFNVVQRPDGSAYIKVSSREPVREPYLDFLIEATWGSGQVLREYTMLVDPPAMMPAPAPVTRAPVASTPARQAPATPAPRSVSRAPAQAVPSYQPGYQDGEYRTQRNDTLWEIAEQVRPDGSVSMEQTMLGLLEANPDAFYDQNINNLKAGYVMRVPSAAEMTAISQAEAQSEVRRQNRLWREGRSGTVQTAAADSSPTPSDASSGARGQAADGGAQLKLLAPEVGEAGGTDVGSVDELRKELTMAVEAMEAQKQENQDLSTRLVELEDQIAKLHRLLELKDSELAQLGGLAVPTPEADATAAPQAADAPVDTQMAEVPADAAGQDAMPPAMDAVPSAEGEAVMPDMPTAEMAEGMDAVPPEMPADAETAGADETVAEVPPPVVPQPTPAPMDSQADEPAEEQSFIDMLMANPMLKWGAVGGGVLVALLAWMGIRRKRMEDSGFQESILADRGNAATRAAAAAGAATTAAASAASAAPKDESKAEPAVDTTPSQEVASHTDSSLFTDFAVSDMGAIQNDEEADPIAEADVYLAYGRYQQAEELVRSAIGRSPQRNDLKLKLLEVLFAAKNANGFDAEAEAMLANLDGQDDDLWQRVAEMGQELSPTNPMYKADGAAAAAASVAAAAAAPAAAGGDLTSDITADAGLDTGMDLDAGPDMSDITADLNLDSTSAGSTEQSAGLGDDNGLDFDLGEFDSSAKAKEDTAASVPADDDLNFDLSGAEESAEESADGALASSDEVATKLDLARAYMEMGDPDGARSILEEVMQEGNDAQKSEAQSLLQNVS